MRFKAANERLNARVHSAFRARLTEIIIRLEDEADGTLRVEEAMGPDQRFERLGAGRRFYLSHDLVLQRFHLERFELTQPEPRLHP